ncbi:hypothetical protein Q9Q94_14955 [Uliginosibacterium sp. 31-16]|uniref:hypothetical protein n=1 Tax=Uliginosibacterium sp. 31-16 TaxID=3068315 RepID=UPI00273E78F4|nr:hypothetical protein [Uliginosibacterium sp. 31-16]MDP5240842.1 hypothetical protein [Uliginosibacterium sp. 31-16]
MIYVEEKDFSRQLDLIRAISNAERSSFCAWLYPESKAENIAGWRVQKSNLEAVTTYGDNVTPSHTELVNCSEGVIVSVSRAKNDVVAHCDSLVLYKLGATQWFTAVVGHEGMCLVRDDALSSLLQQAGFKVSSEPKNWW